MCKAYGDCLRCGYRSFDVEAIGSQELSGQRPQSTSASFLCEGDPIRFRLPAATDSGFEAFGWIHVSIPNAFGGIGQAVTSNDSTQTKEKARFVLNPQLEELTKHALSAFTMCYSPFDKAFQKHCGKLCPVDFIETSDTIAQALIVAPGGHDLLVVGQKHLSATSDNVSYVRFALLFCLVFVGSR